VFQEKLARAASDVQAYIDRTIQALPSGDLQQAIAYTATGGKRLRAFLVLESAELHGIAREDALPSAAAIECLHAYSLVHDDLPCMDDDDLRRGQPTVHRKWDEATAVLVGDALQTLAFELVLGHSSLPADRRVELGLSLAQASGASGMVYGQALDIAAESASSPLTLPEITTLQAGKTGALIRWSACSGARMAGAQISTLSEFADAMGLAFQIADDILDVEGNEAETGKRLNKDAKAGKATFVSLLGLNGAKQRASELVMQAENALSVYGDRAEALKEAARFAIARKS